MYVIKHVQTKLTKLFSVPKASFRFALLEIPPADGDSPVQLVRELATLLFHLGMETHGVFDVVETQIHHLLHLRIHLPLRYSFSHRRVIDLGLLEESLGHVP